MSDVKVLIRKEQIQERIKELSRIIAKDFADKHLVLVCVLNGAYIFASDFSKALWEAGHTDFEIDFVRISSYGVEKESSRAPKLTKDIETDIEGKHILIIEDIIETGHTLKFLVNHLLLQKPESIKVCAFLAKPLREANIEPDYLGFEVDPNDWVEGYGLDTASQGRGRGEIVKINYE